MHASSKTNHILNSQRPIVLAFLSTIVLTNDKLRRYLSQTEIFETLLNLEHILPELEHSCHVSSSHSTNVVACKRFSSSFPIDFSTQYPILLCPSILNPLRDEQVQVERKFKW